MTDEVGSLLRRMKWAGFTTRPVPEADDAMQTPIEDDLYSSKARRARADARKALESEMWSRREREEASRATAGFNGQQRATDGKLLLHAVRNHDERMTGVESTRVLPDPTALPANRKQFTACFIPEETPAAPVTRAARLSVPRGSRGIAKGKGKGKPHAFGRSIQAALAVKLQPAPIDRRGSSHAEHPTPSLPHVSTSVNDDGPDGRGRRKRRGSTEDKLWRADNTPPLEDPSVHVSSEAGSDARPLTRAGREQERATTAAIRHRRAARNVGETAGGPRGTRVGHDDILKAYEALQGAHSEEPPRDGNGAFVHDIEAQLLKPPSAQVGPGKKSKKRQARLSLKRSEKPFWRRKEEELEAVVSSRRMRGEVLAALVKQANPGTDSPLSAAFDQQRQLGLKRANAAMASLEVKPDDPDALAAFRVNIKDVAATRPYLVVPPITAPRKHRQAVVIESEEEEEIFDFEASFWSPREEESDSRDFYDTEDTFRRRLAVDWKRCIAKSRFKDYLLKEDKRAQEELERRNALEAEGKAYDTAMVGARSESVWERTKIEMLDSKKNDDPSSLMDFLSGGELAKVKKQIEKEEQERKEREARQEESILKNIRTQLRAAYPVLCSIHAYYSMISGTTGDTFFAIKMVGWREFMEDAAIPEQNSDACTREDCDRIFMAANIIDREQKGNAEWTQHNAPDSLTRWEFLEAIIRLACAKYIPSVKTTTTVTTARRRSSVARSSLGHEEEEEEERGVILNDALEIKRTRKKHSMSQVAFSVPEALEMFMAHVAPKEPPMPLHKISKILAQKMRREKSLAKRAAAKAAEAAAGSLPGIGAAKFGAAKLGAAKFGAMPSLQEGVPSLGVAPVLGTPTLKPARRAPGSKWGDVADAFVGEPELSAIAQTQPEAVLDHNKFRANRIYTNNVSDVMKQWKHLLQAMFNCYKSKVKGDRMHMDGFVECCEEAGLTSYRTGLSRREAMLSFIFSQMETVDDVTK